MAAVQGNSKIALVNSEALEYEMRRIPNDQRRQEMEAILTLAQERAVLTDQAERLAEVLANNGIGSMDAVHLAIASTSAVDYFVTCDDKLLRKAKTVAGLDCTVVSVLTLVSEVL